MNKGQSPSTQMEMWSKLDCSWLWLDHTTQCLHLPLLDLAGIDTGIFKVHSTQRAAASAAANVATTTTDILKAADLSSETVSTKVYYKPLRSSAFAIRATNYHS